MVDKSIANDTLDLFPVTKKISFISSGRRVGTFSSRRWLLPQQPAYLVAPSSPALLKLLSDFSLGNFSITSTRMFYTILNSTNWHRLTFVIIFAAHVNGTRNGGDTADITGCCFCTHHCSVHLLGPDVTQAAVSSSKRAFLRGMLNA